jgi:hypothetical protein
VLLCLTGAYDYAANVASQLLFHAFLCFVRTIKTLSNLRHAKSSLVDAVGNSITDNTGALEERVR